MTPLPLVEKKDYANGLRVLFMHTPNDPISACHLFLPHGSATEPANKGGLTSLLCGLLTKGTKTKTSRTIAEEVEGIGASLGAGVTHDFANVSCQSASEYFQKILTIMAEICFEPAFLSQEIEKEKIVHVAGIQSKKESVFTVSHELLNHHLFGDHPYAHPTSGEEASIPLLTESDIRARHAQIFSPKGAVLSIASSFPFEQIEPWIAQLFGPKSWMLPANNLSNTFNSPLELIEKKLINSESPFEQAFLMMGFPAPSVHSEDYIPLKILNGILGGGMSSRLFQNLREKKGLAYDVGSFFPTRKMKANFSIYIGLKAERMDEAKTEIARELEGITTETISDEERLHVIQHLKGSYILDHQTNNQRAHYVGWWEILGLSADYDRTYIDQLGKVSSATLSKTAKAYFSKPSVTITMLPKQSNGTLSSK